MVLNAFLCVSKILLFDQLSEGFFGKNELQNLCKQECVQLLKETDQVVLNVDQYKINWFWGLMTVHSVKDKA